MSETKQKNLVLFSQYYLEVFLKYEIKTLSDNFESIYAFPLNINTNSEEYPSNTKQIKFDYEPRVILKKLLIRYFLLFNQWFLHELIFSKKRGEYIKNFKKYFFLLARNLQVAHNFKTQFPELCNSSDTIFYAYWFDDQGSIVTLLNRIGVKGKFISRVHLFDFQVEYRNNNYIPFRKIESQYLDKIYPISNFATLYLKERFNIINTKTSHLGVINRGNNPISIDKQLYTIVSCSRLSWEKRPLFLVDLMGKLNLNINWIHYGAGPMEKEFIEKAKTLPLNIKHEFRGNVSNEDIISFYNTNPVDLFVNVSEFEGIPVTLMEAISFGIPIVGCRVGGVAEIVNDSTGLLLDKDFDVIEVANKIDQFLQFKARTKETRENVKQFWALNFDAEVNANIFVNEILNLK